MARSRRRDEGASGRSPVSGASASSGGLTSSCAGSGGINCWKGAQTQDGTLPWPARGAGITVFMSRPHSYCGLRHAIRESDNFPGWHLCRRADRASPRRTAGACDPVLGAKGAECNPFGVTGGKRFLLDAARTETRRASQRRCTLNRAVVKRAAEDAGLHPDEYSGHSLRAGLVTAAAKAGRSMRSIKKTTGHRPSRPPRGRARRPGAPRGAPGRRCRLPGALRRALRLPAGVGRRACWPLGHQIPDVIVIDPRVAASSCAAGALGAPSSASGAVPVAASSCAPGLVLLARHQGDALGLAPSPGRCRAIFSTRDTPELTTHGS
jgi:hypothetical protein